MSDATFADVYAQQEARRRRILDDFAASKDVKPIESETPTGGESTATEGEPATAAGAVDGTAPVASDAPTES